MTNLLISVDLLLTLIAIGLAINEFFDIRNNLRRLKQDHFDLQVAFTKIMDAVEHNKYEITGLKSQRDKHDSQRNS